VDAQWYHYYQLQSSIQRSFLHKQNILVHIQSTQLNVIQAVRHDKWTQVTDIKTQVSWQLTNTMLSYVMFRREELLMKLHLWGTACHLPYEITVLPDTRHKWTQSALIPTSQTGSRFTTPDGWKADLSLVTGNIPRCFTHWQMVSHPSINWAVHSREMNSQPVDLTSDVLTTSKPNPDPPEDQYHHISSKLHLKRWTLRYKKKRKNNICAMDIHCKGTALHLHVKVYVS